MCMIGNPNETYYRYLARSRSGRSQRDGVPEREPKREDGEVRCISRCEGREGAGGTRKALEGIAALALVLFLLIPGVAYASLASDQYGEPVYGPVTYDWQGETWTSVAYIAANKFDAAAYACGYSKSEIGQWDLTVRAKLSNESTAPDFYELASGFYAPVADDFVYTDQGPAPGFWGWAYSIYGEGNIWYHDGYTDTQVNDAKSEVEAILNGGGSGGGSGGSAPEVSGYVVFPHGEYDGSSMTFYNIAGNDSVTVPFPSLSYDDGYVVIALGRFNEPSSYDTVQVFEVVYRIVPENCGLYYKTNDTGALYWYVNGRAYCGAGEVKYRRTRVSNTASWGDLVQTRHDNYGWWYPSSGMSILGTTVYGQIYGCFPSAVVVPPENNWPETDDPDVPTPPSPDAPSGGGNYVAPTLPKPTSPTQPTNVSVTVVTPVDDILDALNKIIEELENHCVHLQNKMVECARYIGGLTEQTRDAVIDAINESMSNSVALHGELMSYLEELFQWMKDNMNYNVEVTNTNNNDDVIDWLKRIYIQDGTGYSNTKPIDITQDYNGFAVWVDGVIDNLLPDLTDTNLAPVTSAFDALDDKFPFSVPGDVLRIFQSLDRSPVTPVVSFTIPAMLGISSYSYSFDLSPYNGTMETIRTIELMAFVVFLLVWARRAFNAEAGGASD